MNKFLKEFKDRGFFYQCTSEDELSKQLDEEKIKGYIGFDCTAESLHVGSLPVSYTHLTLPTITGV